MPLYVRKSRKGDWDKVTNDTPEDLNFPASVLADLLDSENEISVWEVSDPPKPEELDTIVAALHDRGVTSVTDVTLRSISGWKIKDGLKLTMRTTKGESLDSKLNGSGKHSVVEINTAGDAIRVAKALKERKPIFYGKDQVMRTVASSIASGRIKVEAIGSSLLKKLFDEGHLQLASPPQSGPASTDGSGSPKPV